MKSKLSLIAALLVGGLALLAIHSYISNVEHDAKLKLQGDPVVSARIDIPEGTELSIEMLTPKNIPPGFIPRQAIQGSSELKQILGRKTSVPIHAGQILLWSDLLSEKKGSFSSIIPEGEDAFSVEIAKGIKGGLVQPNDHVDIIASFAVPKPPSASSTPAIAWKQEADIVNVVLLQNITVLAVGNNFDLNGQGPASTDVGAPLTLAVTLQEAQLLMFASDHGEIGAVLRKDGTTATQPRAELPRITFEAVEGIIGTLEQQRKQRTIEIQKGRQVEAVTVKGT